MGAADSCSLHSSHPQPWWPACEQSNPPLARPTGRWAYSHVLRTLFCVQSLHKYSRVLPRSVQAALSAAPGVSLRPEVGDRAQGFREAWGGALRGAGGLWELELMQAGHHPHSPASQTPSTSSPEGPPHLSIPPVAMLYLVPPCGAHLGPVRWEWSGGKEACCDLPPCPRPCPGAPKPSQLCNLPGQLVRGGRGYQGPGLARGGRRAHPALRASAQRTGKGSRGRGLGPRRVGEASI